MRIKDLMTTDVITLNEDDNLDLAQMEMSLARIRHLPVVRQGRLVGLVTHRDIVGAMCSVIADIDTAQQHMLLKQVSVMKIMSRDVKTIEPERTVTDAAKLLLESKFGCLPVVADGDRLVGIVTEADFVELAVQILESRDDRRGAVVDPPGEARARISDDDDRGW
jgi:CBS domain-containing membrane protein